jgi:hypothetical protein
MASLNDALDWACARIFKMVIGGILVLCAVVALILVNLLLIVNPEKVCESYPTQIGEALHGYAKEHGGKYPPLSKECGVGFLDEAFLKEWISDKNVMACHWSGRKFASRCGSETSYFYTGFLLKTNEDVDRLLAEDYEGLTPLTVAEGGDYPVLIESDHAKGFIRPHPRVLFLDGRVEHLDEHLTGPLTYLTRRLGLQVK